MLHPEKKRINHTSKKTILQRMTVMIFRVGMSCFLLLFLLISLLYLPLAQNWITGKAEQFLIEKLSTKVEVGGIHLNFAAQLVISDLYVEDQQQDTLWSSEVLYLDVPVLPLFRQELIFRKIELQGVKCKYVIFGGQQSRTNLDFILRVFGSNGKEDESKNGWRIDVENLSLHNIDFLYDDQQAASHVQVNLGHLEISGEQSDVASLNFHLSQAQLQNTSVKIKKGKTSTNAPASSEMEAERSSGGIPLLAKINQMALESCTLLYTGPSKNENTRVTLGRLNLKDFVLDGMKYYLQADTFRIADSRLAIAMPASEKDTAQITAPVSLDVGWHADLRAFQLENNSFFFHQSALGDTLYTSGLLLNVSAIDLTVDNISLHRDTLQAKIEKLSFHENKGLTLQESRADLFLCDEKLAIQNLLFKTPYSEISGGFEAQNASLFSSAQVLEKLRLTLQLHPSTIGRPDLHYLIPAVVAQYPDIHRIAIETTIAGSVNDLTVHHFQTNLDEEVFLAASGKLAGLPDLEKTNAAMNIDARYLSQRGWKKILGQVLPADGYRLPPTLALKGTVEGTKDHFKAGLQLNSPAGNVDGLFSYQKGAARKDTFQCELSFAGLDLEKIYPAVAVTNMTGKIDVRGSGLMNQQYAVQSNLKVDSFTYDNNQYKDVALQAQYRQQEAFARLQMNDPHLQLAGEGHWADNDTVQKAEVDLAIDAADLNALHFTNSPFTLQGKLHAQMTFGTDFLQLAADLKEMTVEKESPYRVNDLYLTSMMHGRFFKIDINSQSFQGAFESNIHPDTLPSLLMNHFSSYLSAESEDSLHTNGYYRLKLSFEESSALDQLLPEVEAIHITTLESTFDAARKDFQFILDIPYLKYTGIEADSLKFDIRSDQKSLAYRVHVPSVGKDSLSLKNLSFSGDLSEGKLINEVSLKDSLQKDRFKIGFLLEGIKQKGIALSLIPEQTLLNYDRWTVEGDNQVIFTEGFPSLGSLMISHDHQALGIQLTPAEMHIHIADIPLEMFAELIEQQHDTLLLSGLLNGTATIQRTENSRQTAMQMSIADCHVMNTSLGNIETTATSMPDDKLEVFLSLKNENNTATVRGSYAYTEQASPLTLQFDMDCKDLSVFQSFANGEITDLQGQIVAAIAATGNLDNIDAKGHITFQEAAFRVQQLNNTFRLANETILLDQAGLKLSNFTLQDVNNNQFVIDGNLITQDYQHLNVDLDITGNQFTVLNSTSTDNPEFFGALVMSAKAHMQGQLPDLRIDADLSIDEGTRLTYVMPPSEINMISDEGIVEFMAPAGALAAESSDIQEQLPGPVLAQLSGLNLTGTLNIHKDAAFRVDIDPRSGDYTTVNGEGKLNIGISNGQNLSLTGTYQITQGVYEVSFYNLVRKTFQIGEGSLLSWTGDPYTPLFDIRAYNEIKTASTGLVANEIAGLSDDAKRTYQKPLPYEVIIFIQGNPLSTEVGFSIDLPDQEKLSYPVIASKLQRLNEKGNESLLTQQVFGLLTIGSFIPERSTNISGDYSVAFASTAAVNSLNGILTNELNKLSGQYLKGFQVDVGLQSSQDLSSGNEMTTMMDIKVSKTLFNEHLVLEAESSFDVEGYSNYSSTQNDIAIVYDLSRGGDYKLKAFNISSYDVVYKDIRTSGISLIFVKEYDPVKKRELRKKDKRKVKDSTDGISQEHSN